MDDGLEWVHDDLGSFGEMEAEVLSKVCEEHDVPAELVKRLLDTEFQHYGMKRRSSIYSQLDKVMREEWRSMKEIVAEIEGEDRVEAWQYDGMEQN
jgi:DNA sulfur modification protein DndC